MKRKGDWGPTGSPAFRFHGEVAEVDFVFVDRGRPALEFIEVERQDGRSISVGKFGKWIRRADGHHVLRLKVVIEEDST